MSAGGQGVARSSQPDGTVTTTSVLRAVGRLAGSRVERTQVAFSTSIRTIPTSNEPRRVMSVDATSVTTSSSPSSRTEGAASRHSYGRGSPEFTASRHLITSR
ncbi:hypothetical protein BBK82_26550 [Lentzea guizhouensis]|uniref:Uncharacterized protein n=1 Tax=Lentzea guizhouensis TaxID=1586287 RepID=A0A1B2HN04_9PSEU|nr:hypothetical protein BBK82_26550 [Lentzea guizhouensis]